MTHDLKHAANDEPESLPVFTLMQEPDGTPVFVIGLPRRLIENMQAGRFMGADIGIAVGGELKLTIFAGETREQCIETMMLIARPTAGETKS